MRYDDAQELLKLALNRLNRPVMIVDGGLAIHFTTTAADELLGAGDGMCRTHDGLRLVSGGLQNRLEHDARRIVMSGATVGHVSLEVPRRSINSPLRLSLSTAVTATSGVLATGRILILVDQGAHTPTADGLMLHFPLTEAEARTAALAIQALAVREIADRLGVTGNTVKAHLKSVYQKLDVHSRAELVRTIAHSLPEHASGEAAVPAASFGLTRSGEARWARSW